ncbi:unnamed protein product [Prorocentrum cordatum]|uniref:Uncharacterized protein n=1 Tax=Prorocentrum cordatum TaxID=2364126 RepID=A0ABN9U058_9DINO|nr:unnamed protein product [Polarella glacialis]
MALELHPGKDLVPRSLLSTAVPMTLTTKRPYLSKFCMNMWCRWTCLILPRPSLLCDDMAAELSDSMIRVPADDSLEARQVSHWRLAHSTAHLLRSDLHVVPLASHEQKLTDVTRLFMLLPSLGAPPALARSSPALPARRLLALGMVCAGPGLHTSFARVLAHGILPAVLPSYRRKLLHWLADEIGLPHVSADMPDGSRRLHIATEREALPDRFFVEGEEVEVTRGRHAAVAVVVDPRMHRRQRTIRVRFQGAREEVDVPVETATPINTSAEARALRNSNAEEGNADP